MAWIQAVISNFSVVHLTFGEGLSPVFLAQVARPMSLVQHKGLDVTLTIFCPLGQFLRAEPRQRWAQQKKSLHEDFALKIKRLLSPPSRVATLWNNSNVFRTWIERQPIRSERVVIHCRGSKAALIATEATRHLQGFSILFDSRGVEGPEFLLVNGYSSAEEAPPHVREKAKRYEEAQRLAAQSSNGIVCVSYAMKRFIQQKWFIPNDKIIVVPCCANFEARTLASRKRRELRERLKIEHRLVIVYCGSLEPWQMATESLDIVRSIMEMRNNAYFLAITTKPQEMSFMADRAGIAHQKRSILSVPHCEISDYLVAADIGMLIRSRSLVNTVASPVKFAEYLASGVPVILTEGIGDYSDLVRKNGLGCVISDAAASNETRQAIAGFLSKLSIGADTVRMRCFTTGKSHLSWERSIDALCHFYHHSCSRDVTTDQFEHIREAGQ